MAAENFKVKGKYYEKMYYGNRDRHNGKIYYPFRGAVVAADDVLFSVKELTRHRTIRKAAQQCGAHNLSLDQLDLLWSDETGERTKIMGLSPECWWKFGNSSRDIIKPEDITLQEGASDFLYNIVGGKCLDTPLGVEGRGKIVLVFYSPKGVDEIVMDMLFKDKRVRDLVAFTAGVHCSYRNGTVEGKQLSKIMDRALAQFEIAGKHMVHVNYLKRGRDDALGHNMRFFSFDPNNQSGSKTRYQLEIAHSLKDILDKINVFDVLGDDAGEEDKENSGSGKDYVK
jgi:hypothetical protein